MSETVTVSDYINKMAIASKTKQHEVIEEFLDYFGLSGTQEATLEQAAAFWDLVASPEKL